MRVNNPLNITSSKIGTSLQYTISLPKVTTSLAAWSSVGTAIAAESQLADLRDDSISTESVTRNTMEVLIDMNGNKIVDTIINGGNF